MNSETKSRDMRLDAIRGLLLMMMAAVHVPTPLSEKMHEPFGCFGNAEGFFFLSAYLSGLAYGKILWQADWPTMARRVLKRVRLIYLVHLGLVLPVALIAWSVAGRVTPLANHFHDFLVHPWGSLVLLPLLLHQPPLFDILPLYVIFLGITPWLLSWSRRHGWRVVVLASILVWLITQGSWDDDFFTGSGQWLPLRWGSFHLFSWQLLWVVGLATGEISLHRPVIGPALRPGLGATAALVVVAGFLLRHGGWPAAWSSPDLYLWMDKWTLGPLRLLNFAAWVGLLTVWNPRLPSRLLSPAALLGRHSLSVFSFHLPLVIIASSIIQLVPMTDARQTLVGFLVVAALFPWALWREGRLHREVPEATPVPNNAAWSPSAGFLMNIMTKAATFLF